MNWALKLMEYTKKSPYATESTKQIIDKYYDDILLESSSTDMFDILVDCLQYMKENASKDEYKETKKVISEFYGENKVEYIDEVMTEAYTDNAHDLMIQLENLRELGDIDNYTEAYANDVIKNTLSFQYYPKVAMGEIRISNFMDNMVELMQLYQPAKMVFGEDPDESDTMQCCMSSYEKARKQYEELKNFPLSDIPDVQIESYINNSTNKDVNVIFENFSLYNKMRNRQKIENKYDLRPFPLTHVPSWNLQMESVSINNVHKYITGFESIPAYEVSGGVHAVGQKTEEWQSLKKAVLSYMNAGRHSDCVAVGNLDIKTEHKQINTFLNKEKTDQNAKVDTGKIGMDSIDKGTTVVIKRYTRNGSPFFAYVQVGDTKGKCQAWILYKDTIAKRHCMYYMAHALSTLNLTSPTVEVWAKKQLEEFKTMKNPYDKDGKTVIAKESNDDFGDMSKALNSMSDGLKDNDLDNLSKDIEKEMNSNTSSTADEATHVGTMLPQIPVTSDTTRDENPSLYVPEGDTRPDTKYIRWDDDSFGISDTYKIGKANSIIDASRVPMVQEAVKYAKEICENVSKDPDERQFQKIALLDYIRTITESLKTHFDESDMREFNESALDTINFIFEKCYKDQTGDFVDIYEFTTGIADSLLEEKSSLPTFYATEAADVDLDMKGIVKILNEKGYKVKYSCGGHPASPKKEDRDRNNVYYNKLYTTARIVFDGKYKFQVAPKGWHFNPTTEKNNPPRTSLYADEITYNDKRGSGNQAFLAWKNKYMSALRTWVSQIPNADKMKSRDTDAVAAKISDSSKGKSPEEIKKESVDTIGLTNLNEDYRDFIESVNSIFDGLNPFND